MNTQREVNDMRATKEAIGILRPNAHRVCKTILRPHADLNDVELEPGQQACRILVPDSFQEPTGVFDCGL